MKRMMLAATLALFATSPAMAQLWYNGDRQIAAIVNGLQGSLGTRGLYYDNFSVPSGVGGWVVSSVFINEYGPATESHAYWEIRSGVSAGNGGTLVSSGTGPASITSLPPVVGLGESHRLEVGGLHVFLTPGTYWLAVGPVGDSSPDGNSYIWGTTGSGAIGLPAGNDGKAFVNGPDVGVFQPVDGSYINTLIGITDFSMGVNGVAVPEPRSSVFVGMLCIAGICVRGALKYRPAERVGSAKAC